MKARLTKEIKRLLAVLLFGLAYLMFIRLTGLSVPCPFHLATGLYCPSCGITGMFVALARFDFADAFFHNPVIFVTLPVLLALYLAETIRYIKSGDKRLSTVSKIILSVEIVLLMIYGIIRNFG